MMAWMACLKYYVMCLRASLSAKKTKREEETRSSECWSVTHSWIDENTHLTVLASNHLKSTNGRKLPVTLAGRDYGLNANGMKGAS